MNYPGLQVVHRYLEHLLVKGEVERAAGLCPSLLKVLTGHAHVR